MHHYGVRDVEKLLRLPRTTIRALIDAGFVHPARGPRKAWRFSFQDLIIMRTAQALVTANVPRKRITRSIKDLRRHLPRSMPLSGLSICAVADRVVVREGSRRWQADSGQYLLAFEGDPEHGSLSVFERRQSAQASAQDLLEHAASLEDLDPGAALDTYRRVIAAEPGLVDAYLNSGWLLQNAGQLADAERMYRQGIEACGDEPLLLYNLGVLLVETGRKAEALTTYEAVLRVQPEFADCHYNLALLYEELQRPRDAIRHMAQYRRLLANRSD